jgi:hypothetical protein
MKKIKCNQLIALSLALAIILISIAGLVFHKGVYFYVQIFLKTVS